MLIVVPTALFNVESISFLKAKCPKRLNVLKTDVVHSAVGRCFVIILFCCRCCELHFYDNYHIILSVDCTTS